jgi:hypothetical protein
LYGVNEPPHREKSCFQDRVFLGAQRFEHNPGFGHFVGVGNFRGLVRIAHKKTAKTDIIDSETNDIINIILILLSYLSILSGGGDYRGIYDIGLKGGFYGVYRPFIE